MCSWFCVVNLDLDEFEPHPGDSYEAQRRLLFYVGAKGRQSQIIHRKLKSFVSHSMVILVQEPDN